LRQEAAPPPGSIACRFFAQGSCKFGNKCRFHHSQQALNRNQNRFAAPAPAPGSPCRFFAQGRCRYGQDCRFSHDLSLAQAYSQPYQGVPTPPVGPYGYGTLMDPDLIAQVENELAMEAELDAAIDATIEAQIRAEYESASLEEEALLAEEELIKMEEQTKQQPQPQATQPQSNGDVKPKPAEGHTNESA